MKNPLEYGEEQELQERIKYEFQRLLEEFGPKTLAEIIAEGEIEEEIEAIGALRMREEPEEWVKDPEDWREEEEMWRELEGDFPTCEEVLCGKEEN